jgi:hypothetical protein
VVAEDGRNLQVLRHPLDADDAVDRLVQVVDAALRYPRRMTSMLPASTERCMPGSTDRSSSRTDWLISANWRLSCSVSVLSDASDEQKCTWYAEVPGPVGQLVMKNMKPRPEKTMLKFGNTW